MTIPFNPDPRHDLILNKKYQDSVFTNLFSTNKYTLELYKCFHEKENISESEIKIVTAKNILLSGPYNDLGFVAKDSCIFLIEAQSTWSRHIILREMFYLLSFYINYIKEKNCSLYKDSEIYLPVPEMYVLYTGDRKERINEIYFSDTYFGNVPNINEFDYKIPVLYDGKKKGDILSQYVRFTKITKKQIKIHGKTREAVINTIKICKKENVLYEYLDAREKEVYDIMMTLFDQDYAIEMYVNELKNEFKAEIERKDQEIQKYRQEIQKYRQEFQSKKQ